MRKRVIVLAIFFAVCSSLSLWAGDVASFVNLGFSDDAKYFMFGQYGVTETDNKPYAEIYTVEVVSNNFVPNGVKKAQYSVSVQPGQDGSNALYTLLEDVLPLKKRYKINYLQSGRILYLLLNGDTPKADLEFRDFATGNKYTLTLEQIAEGKDSQIKASFFIKLTVAQKDGTVKNYCVGRPNYFRDGVKSYKIKQVFLSPNEQSLVIVVEKEEVKAGMSGTRYMVETVEIK